MAPTLTVDGYDLSAYVAWGERSADITDPTRLAPQFGGNTALADGQPWIRTSASDKTWQFPLLLNAASTDALHTLVQTINSHLFQGAQVAFKPQGATNTTYFDLEAGRLDAHWDLYIDTAGFLQATLNLWTRPYGHTGTTRLVASVTGTGPLSFPVTGVAGDVAAFANLEWGLGAAGNTMQPVAFFGIATSASYNPLPISTYGVSAQGGTAVGASGAVGSQYVAANLPAFNGFLLQMFNFTLTPGPAHVGRHRVFAIMRQQLLPATVTAYVNLALLNPDSAGSYIAATALTPTQALVSNASQWSLLDLGEITISSEPSGMVDPIWCVKVGTPSLAQPSAVASPVLHLNQVILVPAENLALYKQFAGGTPAASKIAWESWPRERVLRSGTSGVPNHYWDAVMTPMGGPPRIPAVGTASGPARAIAFAVGSPSGVVGNDPLTIKVSVTERFTYLR